MHFTFRARQASQDASSFGAGTTIDDIMANRKMGRKITKQKDPVLASTTRYYVYVLLSTVRTHLAPCGIGDEVGIGHTEEVTPSRDAGYTKPSCSGLVYK